MIDTLAIHDTLKKGEFPENQARAITSVIMQAEADKTETLKTFIGRERQEMDWRFDVVREEMATRADLELIRKEMATKADVHALELKMESLRSELVRWVFACTFGQTALLAGVMYFVLTYVRR